MHITGSQLEESEFVPPVGKPRLYRLCSIEMIDCF